MTINMLAIIGARVLLAACAGSGGSQTVGGSGGGPGDDRGGSSGQTRFSGFSSLPDDGEVTLDGTAMTLPLSDNGCSS